jgi:hypothetical protein
MDLKHKSIFIVKDKDIYGSAAFEGFSWESQKRPLGRP